MHALTRNTTQQHDKVGEGVSSVVIMPPPKIGTIHAVLLWQLIVMCATDPDAERFLRSPVGMQSRPSQFANNEPFLEG